MASKVVWLWENHLGEDAERLSRLRDERDTLDLRLEAIQDEIAAIKEAATAKAKAARDKAKPFTL